MRADVRDAHRVVVKIGSSSLTSADGRINSQRIKDLTGVLVQLRRDGREVVVVSSGAIAAGLSPLQLRSRPRVLDLQQAAAAVGQGLLMHRYTEEFAALDVVAAQVLLTVDDVTRRSHYRNALQTLRKLLDLGVVPVVNENDTVATSEIRFGDNDRLAALVAHIVNADLLVLLSDIDGLYDGNPKHSESTLIGTVTSAADLDGVDIGRPGSAVGTGGMITKVEAAEIATGAGVHVVLTSADNAAQAVRGDDVGTHFVPTGKRRPRRTLWLAHATDPHGQLHLDAGAVKAIVERGASLLPAGIVSGEGDFVAGDPVELVGPDRVAVARGLVNYDAGELPQLLGKSTHELRETLGSVYEREVVHRDDLVLLTTTRPTQ